MLNPITRRELLAQLAVATGASPRIGAAQAPPEQRRLSSAFPLDKLADILVPRDRWRPFSPASERPSWEGLAGDLRSQLIAAGEPHIGAAWPMLPASLLLEFKRIGNRSNYEGVRNVRRGRLKDLVLAECAEDKGRFCDEIVNGLWTTCEETFWGLPAHLGAQRAGPGLPDVTEPVVDLFAAETSSLLAWTDYLLGPSLDKVSPLVRPRIAWEIDRRVLKPCLERDDFAWMGFRSSRPVNNWNPWINSNWLTSTLLMEPDSNRRTGAVHKILRSLDRFLDGYHEDGGCDEGPSYWSRAGASLFDNLELLYSATHGAIDFYSMPLVGQIGRYIWRAHICGDWYLNFADAPARVHIPGDLVYRYGKRIGDENMQLLGASAATATAGAGESIGRSLYAIFNREALRQAPARQPLVRDVWMSGIQVMAARLKDGSPEGLYLAAQGGHNEESHNHNDVGNFVVYADGQPAIVDVGVETYTAKTFGAHRYDIWTMQSPFHNLPTIGGVMQFPGRQAAARAVSYRAVDEAAEFRLDISGAYPPEANMRSWVRTLRLDRKSNEIAIREQFEFSHAPRDITLTFMTPCRPEAAGGRVLLAGGFLKSGRVSIGFDPTVFTVKMEEIPIQDKRLKESWGERLYRVLLRAETPPLKADWKLRVTQA